MEPLTGLHRSMTGTRCDPSSSVHAIGEALTLEPVMKMSEAGFRRRSSARTEMHGVADHNGVSAWRSLFFITAMKCQTDPDETPPYWQRITNAGGEHWFRCPEEFSSVGLFDVASPVEEGFSINIGKTQIQISTYLIE